MSFTEYLGIEFTEIAPDHVAAVMPIRPEILQPFGFVHGGATISLLESVASLGTENIADLDVERPFGIDVHVRHRKSGRAGRVRGVADLARVEGNKYFWDVAAYDDEGDVMSEGTVMCKVVSLERLAEKAREREEGRAAGQGA